MTRKQLLAVALGCGLVLAIAVNGLSFLPWAFGRFFNPFLCGEPSYDLGDLPASALYCFLNYVPNATIDIVAIIARPLVQALGYFGFFISVALLVVIWTIVFSTAIYWFAMWRHTGVPGWTRSLVGLMVVGVVLVLSAWQPYLGTAFGSVGFVYHDSIYSGHVEEERSVENKSLKDQVTTVAAIPVDRLRITSQGTSQIETQGDKAALVLRDKIVTVAAPVSLPCSASHLFLNLHNDDQAVSGFVDISRLAQGTPRGSAIYVLTLASNLPEAVERVALASGGLVPAEYMVVFHFIKEASTESRVELSEIQFTTDTTCNKKTPGAVFTTTPLEFPTQLAQERMEGPNPAMIVRYNDPIQFSAMQFGHAGIVEAQGDTLTFRSQQSPAWISFALDTTDPLNFLTYELEFMSENGSEGVLGLSLNSKSLEASIDERYTPQGTRMQYTIFDEIAPGIHQLSFRLDSYTPQESIVQVKNVRTGYEKR